MKTEIKMQFDPDVAKEVGTDAAIILSNIEFWISKNRKDEERIEEDKRLHYKDGAYWTYNSVQGWLEYFPYLTHDKIRRSLERLETKGYIVSGKFNSKNWDQTKWYTSLRHECPIDWALTPNQLGILAQSNGRPSPTNTIYKTTNSKNTDGNLHTYANSADATFADAGKKESENSSLVENENIYSGLSANYKPNLRKRGKNPRELGTNPRTVGLMDSLVDILGGCRTMERLGKLADWRNNDHTSQEDSEELIDRAKSFDGTLDEFLNSLVNDKPKIQKTASILQQVIDIINPAQKITDTRLRALNARLKEYSADEVLAAAQRFAKDEWRNRPENKKFKSVDYLLMPSKFSRWAEASDDVDETADYLDTMITVQ